MLKAVIFDMDGVLIDSEPVHYQANKQLMENMGYEISYEYYKQFIGSTCTRMWQTIIKDYKLDKTVEWLLVESDKICDEIIRENGYPPVKGAVNLVKDLRQAGYVLAVASSSKPERIEKNVTALDIKHCFYKLVSGEKVENPKPAPDVFLKAAREIGVSPEECIVIEDSDNGVKAAKAAGMVCIGYLNPGSGVQTLSEADYVVESLENIDSFFVNMVYCHTRGEAMIIAETDRLTIRETKVEDVDRFYEIYSEPEITAYMENLYDDINEEREFARNYIENMYKFYEYGMWTVCLKDGKVIGRAGLCNREINGELEIEVGYVIDKAYQNQGYATEAIKASLDYAKNRLEVSHVNAFIRKGNEASIKAVKKTGFRYVQEAEIDEHEYEIYRKNLI
ncbi:MAG: GNAT family N-acetyltransferase [Lachnospiraceae bacterium]|nr:GNAT family N-acetyltransferase [Lachnospiraceae bacterium]